MIVTAVMIWNTKTECVSAKTTGYGLSGRDLLVSCLTLWLAQKTMFRNLVDSKISRMISLITSENCVGPHNIFLIVKGHGLMQRNRVRCVYKFLYYHNVGCKHLLTILRGVWFRILSALSVCWWRVSRAVNGALKCFTTVGRSRIGGGLCGLESACSRQLFEGWIAYDGQWLFAIFCCGLQWPV